MKKTGIYCQSILLQIVEKKCGGNVARGMSGKQGYRVEIEEMVVHTALV